LSATTGLTGDAVTLTCNDGYIIAFDNAEDAAADAVNEGDDSDPKTSNIVCRADGAWTPAPAKRARCVPMVAADEFEFVSPYGEVTVRWTVSAVGAARSFSFF
jgi:hypothetical protein